MAAPDFTRSQRRRGACASQGRQRALPSRRGSLPDRAEGSAGEHGAGAAPVRHDPWLQRLARAARADLRRRLRRAVRHPRRGQRDLARGHGDAAVRRRAPARRRSSWCSVTKDAGPSLPRLPRGAARRASASRIARLLDNIVPGSAICPRACPPRTRWIAAVDANVRWSIRQLLETPEGKRAPRGGRHEDRRRGLRDQTRTRAISRLIPAPHGA